MRGTKGLFVLLLLILAVTVVAHVGAAGTNRGGGGGSGRSNAAPKKKTGPKDRWALVVSTSRFWHNYRHAANALSLYHILRGRHIPDSNILLMLPETYACDPRNIQPSTIYNNHDHQINLHRCDVVVDFTGYQVNIRNTLEVLQGLYDPVTTPTSRRMLSGPDSNVLWYMTGHGGEGFLKYQDADTISSEDIALTVDLMHQRQRYGKLLIIIETCQGESLCKDIRAPNAVCVSSSLIGEDSYSHHSDLELGVPVIDRFTYETLQFFRKIPPHRRRQVTLWEMLNSYSKQTLLSTANWVPKNRTLLQSWKVHEFFEAPPSSKGNTALVGGDGDGEDGGVYPIKTLEELFAIPPES